MARKAKFPKSKLTERLTDVFLFYGYDGASLSTLADAVELSKASLYHHFPGGKEEMASYALARAGAGLQSKVIAPLQSHKPPEDRIRQSLAATRRYYDGTPPACVLNIMGMGSGRALFGKHLSDGVDAWINSLARTLSDIGLAKDRATQEAQAAIAGIQGALVLCRVKGDRSALEEELDRLERRLLSLA